MEFLGQNTIIIESYNPIQLKVKQHISKDESIIHEENFQKETGNKGMKNTSEFCRGGPGAQPQGYSFQTV